MYLETYLNAMEKNHDQLVLVGPLHPRHLRALRQYRAFRDRILRLGNDHEEAYYHGVETGLEVRQDTIDLLKAEIARLRNYVPSYQKDWDTPEEDEAWKDL